MKNKKYFKKTNKLFGEQKQKIEKKQFFGEINNKHLGEN